QLNSFGCGLDALTTDEVQEITPDIMPSTVTSAHEGSGEIDGLQYQWTIKWDTPGDDVDCDEGNLLIHKSEWTDFAQAVVKVSFSASKTSEESSGVIPAGGIRFTLPLHAFYGWDADADYITNGSVIKTDRGGIPVGKVSGYEQCAEGSGNVFTYELDEENDQLIIYNFADCGPGASMGCQISYKVDPYKVNGGHPKTENFNAAGSANWWLDNEGNFNYEDYYQKELHGTFEIDSNKDDKPEVAADSQLDIAMVTRAVGSGSVTNMPTATSGVYLSWDDSWGEKPADADDYFYMVWNLGYGWGARGHYRYPTQGWEAQVNALKSKNTVTIGEGEDAQTFEGEIVGIDWRTHAYAWPKYVPAASVNYTYMRDGHTLAGLGGKWVDTYRPARYDGLRALDSEYWSMDYCMNKASNIEDVTAVSEVRTGGSFAILMRYPRDIFDAAREYYHDPDYMKNQGLDIGATMTITETWDSDYERTYDVTAPPVTVVVKTGGGSGHFNKSVGDTNNLGRTAGGGQDMLLDGYDVRLNQAPSNTNGGKYVATWVMTYRGEAFTEGATNLGQHIEVTDTKDSTLLISSSKAATGRTSWTPSDQHKLSGELGDYSIAGFWLGLSEYTGTYDESLDTWTPASVPSTDYANYKPVYIYTRFAGGTFEPYCQVTRTASGYVCKAWSGGDNVGATIKKSWGHFPLPEGTIQIKAEHDAEGEMYRSILTLYVGMQINATPAVQGYVQEHVDAGATTYIKDVASYKSTPKNDPSTGHDDSLVIQGDNTSGDAEKTIFKLDRANPSLSVSKSSFTPDDSNAAQAQAKENGKQISYVDLRANSTYHVSQPVTVLTDAEDPYKLLEGTFYDLLPVGTSYQDGSVRIMFDMYYNSTPTASAYPSVASGSYSHSSRRMVPQDCIDVEQSVDTSTGQVMLKIHYKIDDPHMNFSHNYDFWRNYVHCFFVVENPLENIQTYGRQTVNACAFVNQTEGGGHNNATMEKLDAAQMGVNHQGKERKEAFINRGLVDGTKQACFSKATINWNSLTYTETSFGKTTEGNQTIDGMPTGLYASEGEVMVGGEYSYRLLYRLNDSTQAKNVVFYDVLDNGVTTGTTDHDSDWRGELVKVDTSRIETMVNEADSDAFCKPEVYYSTVDQGKTSTSNSYFDIAATEGGEAVWVKASDYSGELSAVKAIAVDCSKDTKGNSYRMGPDMVMPVFVTMKAPAEMPEGEEPTAVNGAVIVAEAFGMDEGGAAPTALISEARMLLLDIDVALSKDASPKTGTSDAPTIVSADGSGKIVYRLTVSNTGEYDVDNVVVEDDIPDDLTITKIGVALNGNDEVTVYDAEDGTVNADDLPYFDYDLDEDTFTIHKQFKTTEEKNQDTQIFVYTTVDSLMSDPNNNKEQVISRDYQNTATLVSANGITIGEETDTTYHHAETTKVLVTKKWSDESDRDGIRPESVEVTLTGKAGNATPYTGKATINAAGNWKYTFIDLNRYLVDDEGASFDQPTTATRIKYGTPTETKTDVITGKNGPGTYSYKVTGSEAKGYTVTNTHTPVKIKVDVEKIWDKDSDDLFELRAPVTVKLLQDRADSGKTVELNEANSWKGSFTGLYKFRDHGTPIEYTIDEIQVPGYKKGVIAGGSVDTGFSYTVKNELDTVNITLTKYWDDMDNVMGDRPDADNPEDTSIDDPYAANYLTLKQNNAAFTKVTPTVTDNNDGTYTVTWTGVPKTGKDNKNFTYSISEAAIANYNEGKEDMEATLVNETDPYTFEITNVRDKGDLKVTKTVYSPYEADANKEFDFTVTLTKADRTTPLSGTFGTGEAAVTFDASGQATFKLKSGDTKEIKGIPTTAQFTVAEAEDTSFQTVKNGDSDTITLTAATADFVNIRLIDVNATKVWNDVENHDGLRPESVTFQLWKALGDDPAEAVVNSNTELSGTNLTATYGGLPTYEKVNGEYVRATYSVRELDANGTAIDPKGGDYDPFYTAAYAQNPDDPYTFTITNKHVPLTMDIPFSKVGKPGQQATTYELDGFTFKLWTDKGHTKPFKGLEPAEDDAQIEATSDSSGTVTFAKLPYNKTLNPQAKPEAYYVTEVVPEGSIYRDNGTVYELVLTMPTRAQLEDNPKATGTWELTVVEGTGDGKTGALTGAGTATDPYTIENRPQVGDLVITKTLDTYETGSAKATFAYTVKAEMEIKGETVTVFTSAASIDFTDAGEQSVTVKGIPVGSTVTVVEDYGGSTYKAVGPTTVTPEGTINVAAPLEATFENDYEPDNRGGYGVDNRFTSDGKGGWAHSVGEPTEQQADDTPAEPQE
ncbi:MAG: Cna B-type domain-containing protein, partial [Atopobiaceae bacterium]|nr:Cna B-type domain-containing protein [Atopobiaceae bacterium]